MDVFDRAQEADELFQQAALKDHFSRQGKLEESPEDAPSTHRGEGLSSGQRLCIACGKKISAARLEANPKAVRCVGCQTKKEQEQ